MKIERGAAGAEVASLADYKSRKGDLARHPAAVSKLQYRGPYGYGGTKPSMEALSGASTNPNGDEAQRRTEFRNTLYEMGFRHAVKPQTQTDAKVLPFLNKSDPSE